MSNRSYVTVVSGLPRSGTSMMMQMLAAGGIPPLTDEVRKPDDDNPRGYYEYEAVKRTKTDPSWVDGAVGKVVKLVHLILRDLPDTQRYRVVFMRRNLDEVLKSQNIMLERQGKSTADLPPERVKELFATQIRELLDYMRNRPQQFDFIEINYNELMRDPGPHITRLSTFLGGLDQVAMRKAVDSSLYRNRAGG
jgi:LPS sulfotransferase NodH